MGGSFQDLDVPSPTDLQVNSIDKILVPVDGSDVSFDAVKYAVHLAKRYNSEICLVHIVPTYVWGYCLMTEDWSPGLVYTKKDMETDGERLLLSALTSVKEPGMRVDAQLDYGRPAKKIIQIAKERNFDLIVIGSRSLGFIARLLLRSVSDEVIHRAPCPVLVVKKPPHKDESGEG